MKTKSKIIIIEDEPDLRNTICDLLEVSGYEVETASNGIEGCQLILEKFPDLVICDINMPKMNGYEVLSAISKQLKEELIPVFLFLTARVQIEDIKQGLRLGADDYITKPFVFTELLDAIEMRLKKRKSLLDFQKEGILEKKEPEGNKINTKISIPFDHGYRYVEANNIVMCVADRAYSIFHLITGEKIVVSKSMKEFQDILEQRGFIRVHKSYIVNIDYVDRYIRGKGGYLVLKDGSHVNVAVRKKDEVMKALC